MGKILHAAGLACGLAGLLLGSTIATHAEEPAAAPKPPSQTTVRVGPDGFTLESADGAFKLRLRSLVQVDGRAFVDDPGTEGNDEFLIRRARIEVTGTLAKNVEFRIMPDFAGTSTQLLDAWVQWNVKPTVGVQFGKVKSPVGLEREQSRENNLFAEFGYPTLLVPNRDIGVAVRGAAWGKRLDWYLGGSNGTSDGASVIDDTDDGKTATVRLLATPFVESKTWGALAFGIAGTHGDTENRLPSDYLTVGQQTFFTWRKPSATSTGAVVDGEVRRIVPQLYWFVGRFGMLAEYATSSQEIALDGTRDTLENTAYQVSVSYVLTGERATWKGVKPDKPIGTAEGGGRGAWQIAARYTALDVDAAAFPVFADPAVSASAARTATLGVNWYVTTQIRFLLNYSRTEFDAVAPVPSPEDEQAIVGRAQFRF